jgi:hypothetical protein
MANESSTRTLVGGTLLSYPSAVSLLVVVAILNGEKKFLRLLVEQTYILLLLVAAVV